MILEQLELYAMGIKRPKRVMIKPSPLIAVSLRRARIHRIYYDRILIRKDGWSIAFPNRWWTEAFDLFPNDWEAAVDLTWQRVWRLGPSVQKGAGDDR